MKNVTLEARQIVFKSVGYVGKLSIQPPKDTMQRMVGVYTPSEDEKRRLAYYVEPTSTRVIQAGTILNLADPKDSADWQWISKSRGIGLSEEEAMSNPEIYYYVFDEETEYQKDLRKDELQAKAMQHVLNTPDSQLAEKARLLGQKMDSFSPMPIRKFLYAQAKNDNIANVKALIDAYEDKDANYKLTLIELVDKHIVKIMSGIYLYGDIPLGMNVDQCVFFLKDPTHEEIVHQMIKKANPGSSILAMDRRVAESPLSDDTEKKVRKKE